MRMNSISYTVLAVFAIAALFGLSVSFMGMGHDAGCPFAAQTAVCMAPLEHVMHWQITFATILAELLALCALVFIFFARAGLLLPEQKQYEKYRAYRQTPRRPTLFQELFSQGILNPKVPLIMTALLSPVTKILWTFNPKYNKFSPSPLPSLLQV